MDGVWASLRGGPDVEPEPRRLLSDPRRPKASRVEPKCDPGTEVEADAEGGPTNVSSRALRRSQERIGTWSRMDSVTN